MAAEITRRPGASDADGLSRDWIAVETVIQVDQRATPGGSGDAPCILRARHRVAPGTTIAQLLVQSGAADCRAAIAAKTLGLSRHGLRAWLDDELVDGDRVEVVAPIKTDAKSARRDRVARDRARRI